MNGDAQGLLEAVCQIIFAYIKGICQLVQGDILAGMLIEPGDQIVHEVCSLCLQPRMFTLINGPVEPEDESVDPQRDCRGFPVAVKMDFLEEGENSGLGSIPFGGIEVPDGAADRCLLHQKNIIGGFVQQFSSISPADPEDKPPVRRAVVCCQRMVLHTRRDEYEISRLERCGSSSDIHLCPSLEKEIELIVIMCMR